MYQLASRCLLFAILISCSSKTEKKQIVDNNKVYYDQVIKYIEMYDTEMDMELYIEGKKYAIEDSLSKYLSKVNIDSLYCDEKFGFIMGNLIEKRYLSLIKIIPKQSVNRSLTYNANAWCYERKSSQSFLNYNYGFRRKSDEKFEEYSSPKTDFICIDSVILKLDNNIFLKKDSIHEVCMQLVRQKKTGGCLW
ncbi:hypothetical protein CLV62_1122 [Dysgonomonas alginatilytica]|uniref:Uncharacterized protein n=1 Tax=Dysgonomonas alginatilytica TaxID=1605892 RepID=A0A2V3PQT6_9BACT|nr:hypothetical protein [Dysgonomonas alginatilytica]PXV63753.1 hypothetical protein CLV62_1122 [Dysgonomonas alginatilytica]